MSSYVDSANHHPYMPVTVEVEERCEYAMRSHCLCFKSFLNSAHKHSLKFSTSASSLILQSQNPYLPTLEVPDRRRELERLLLSPPQNHDPVASYKQVHAQVVVSGFEAFSFFGNILINGYSKAACLREARKLFDKMPIRNLVSWSSVISMYAKHGFGEEALLVFLEFLKCYDETPNEYILASVIRACAQLGGGGSEGGQLHGYVVKSGFEQEVYVGTTLVDYYAKIGSTDEARMVFDSLSVKTTVTWTTIITSYVKGGNGEVSLKLFNQMRENNVVPDKYVLSSALSACSMLRFIEGGKQVHAHVLRRGGEMDLSVTNVLLDFYTKCGRVKTARKLFDQMAVRNAISWTTMIAGYMQNSLNRKAMKLLAEMTCLGWKPDGFACTSVLTSCGSLEALEQGKQVHAYTIKVNLEYDDFVKNGLIDMYSKCNSLTDARRVFDVMDDHNVISYNAMIEGYSRLEKLPEALELFYEMRLRLFPPGLLTFVSLLGVSAALSVLELSRQIHALIIKFGVSFDIFAGSALIDVYSKCSRIKDARLIFEEMNDKDIVVWNAMFSGYVQQLESEEALKLYSKLQLSKQEPDEFTFAALVGATSNLASLQHGQQFHNQLIKVGLDFNPFVTSVLVDMYAKCGSVEEARRAFSSTLQRDVVCWNSMISTYAHNGEAEKALHVFREMINEGITPTYITFVGVLTACGHAGLVEEGLRNFELMSSFGIEPGTEHYASVVSLFGRAGKLYEAREFIEKMPVKPEAVVWRSLLGACRIAGNVELGKYAAEMAISDDPQDSGSYILLSNIFASKSMWVDVKKMRERMDLNRVVKEPGCSWIEANNKVNVFIARDKTHCEADLIYSLLDNLIMHMKGIGYIHDTITLLVND
ncbi:pentatricopeptide repeat-containing protein [Tripterygium wilfordii]|uniref:Pentatricopeptide repeat-containing protein n=1 Tax=Tripterygium wilfordii TaxID=458696 RepID=A0A7J7CUS4_TRIWF|nr:pentatricopeptide repeat-containing protein At4g39530 [Tripterygium wilfordii]KAF5737885.1 pentatricopeptide repeat-containing protein [Tripterygium wilfordii]